MESQFVYYIEMTIPVFKIARVPHSTSFVKTDNFNKTDSCIYSIVALPDIASGGVI